jgi:acetolactate synthase-1/2/3 large subunit
VISDVGAHKMWIARNYHCLRPNTCLISNGFAAMGIAIPGAIAAKLVHPKSQGGGRYRGWRLHDELPGTGNGAAVGTPFVTIIFNDGGYGLIEWKQMNHYGESAYIHFTNPDFVKFAESMGLKGYRIESTEDFIPTLKTALEDEVPVVIDCPVDYRENLLFSQKTNDLSCVI